MTINIPNKECLFRLVSISCVTNDSKGGGITFFTSQKCPRDAEDSKRFLAPTLKQVILVLN